MRSKSFLRPNSGSGCNSNFQMLDSAPDLDFSASDLQLSPTEKPECHEVEAFDSDDSADEFASENDYNSGSFYSLHPIVLQFKQDRPNHSPSNEVSAPVPPDRFVYADLLHHLSLDPLAGVDGEDEIIQKKASLSLDDIEAQSVVVLNCDHHSLEKKSEDPSKSEHTPSKSKSLIGKNEPLKPSASFSKRSKRADGLSCSESKKPKSKSADPLGSQSDHTRSRSSKTFEPVKRSSSLSRRSKRSTEFSPSEKSAGKSKKPNEDDPLRSQSEHTRAKTKSMKSKTDPLKSSASFKSRSKLGSNSDHTSSQSTSVKSTSKPASFKSRSKLTSDPGESKFTNLLGSSSDHSTSTVKPESTKKPVKRSPSLQSRRKRINEVSGASKSTDPLASKSDHTSSAAARKSRTEQLQRSASFKVRPKRTTAATDPLGSQSEHKRSTSKKRIAPLKRSGSCSRGTRRSEEAPNAKLSEKSKDILERCQARARRGNNARTARAAMKRHTSSDDVSLGGMSKGESDKPRRTRRAKSMVEKGNGVALSSLLPKTDQDVDQIDSPVPECEHAEKVRRKRTTSVKQFLESLPSSFETQQSPAQTSCDDMAQVEDFVGVRQMKLTATDDFLQLSMSRLIAANEP